VSTEEKSDTSSFSTTFFLLHRLLRVVAGIYITYLGILLLVSAIQQQCQRCGCICSTLNTLFIGALGSIFFATTLLAVEIATTSVIRGILVGLLLLFFSAEQCNGLPDPAFS